MKEPIFRNKNGDVSRYALNCGHVQRKGAFSLYRESCCYHVVGFSKDGTRHWFSCTSLKEARAKLSFLAHKG